MRRHFAPTTDGYALAYVDIACRDHSSSTLTACGATPLFSTNAPPCLLHATLLTRGFRLARAGAYG